MFLKNVRKKLITNVRYLSSKDSSSTDHYDTLQVSKSATQGEIKNAFFELTKQYHPDKVKATDENISKFRKITEAYEVLGNVDSRRKYDKGTMGDSGVGLQSPEVEEEEEEDDPIKRFYRNQKSRELRATFDAWTVGHTDRIRRDRAAMKEEFEYFQEEKRETDNMNKTLPILPTLVFFLCIYVFYEYASVPAKSNKIERLVNNNRNNDKDQR